MNYNLKRHAISVTAALLMLGGCLPAPNLMLDKSALNQSLAPKPEIQISPRIETLVDHVRCELAKAYFVNAGMQAADDPKHAAPIPTEPKASLAYFRSHADQFPDFDIRPNFRSDRDPQPLTSNPREWLWRRLYEDHYRVAIMFNLYVSAAQALDPQATWSFPKDYRGGSLTIFPPVYTQTKDAAGNTVNTNPSQPTAPYAFSLALNGQFGEIEDKQIQVQYNIDFRNLIDQFQKGDPCTGADVNEPVYANLNFPRLGGGLRGSLGLDEIVGGGLAAIDDAYLGLHSPSRRPGVDAPAKIDVSLGGNGETLFVSRINFVITSSVAGGPSISLLKYKFAGGTGIAAPANSGSTAGGGLPGLLSASRTTQDTMYMTMAPACREGRPGYIVILSAPSHQAAGREVGRPVSLLAPAATEREYQADILSQEPAPAATDPVAGPPNGLQGPIDAAPAARIEAALDGKDEIVVPLAPLNVAPPRPPNRRQSRVSSRQVSQVTPESSFMMGLYAKSLKWDSKRGVYYYGFDESKGNRSLLARVSIQNLALDASQLLAPVKADGVVEIQTSSYVRIHPATANAAGAVDLASCSKVVDGCTKQFKLLDASNTGFLAKQTNCDYKGARECRNLHLVIAMTDPKTGTRVGGIDVDFLAIYVRDEVILRPQNAAITQAADIALGDTSPAFDYWSTIAYCSDNPIEEAIQENNAARITAEGIANLQSAEPADRRR